MPEIQIDVHGRIKTGRFAGQYLTVEDNLEETGGYLVLVEPDASGKNGGDFWIERNELAQAFQEAKWEVDWCDGS